MATKRSLQGTLDALIRLSTEVNVRLGRGEAVPDALWASLTEMTSQLIQQKDRRGALRQHPYARIRRRGGRMSSRVARYLEQKRVLVTGAGGLIGTALCHRLLDYRPRRLILVDRDPSRLRALAGALAPLAGGIRVEKCKVDVANRAGLRRVFERFRPQIVFHLAAQRDPGASEADARDTILSNIRGTENACKLADKFQVETFVHASTGKCRLIYDNRVYPATKKFGETIVKTVADESRTRFSLVRFHHVVENSIAERTFRQQIASGQAVTVHLPPDRRKHGQSAREAVAMLLNAGVYGWKAEVFASSRQMDYFSVLDLALYTLKDSGSSLPVLFKEPKKSEGYQFREFAGTRLAKDKQRETHSFNTIETFGFEVIPGLNLVMTPFPAFDKQKVIEGVRKVVDLTSTGPASAHQMKDCLFHHLFDLAVDMYSRAPMGLLVEAFVQGVSPGALPREEVVHHVPTLTILLQALGSRSPNELHSCDQTALRQSLAHLEQILGRSGDQRNLRQELARVLNRTLL